MTALECPICKSTLEELELGTFDGFVFRCPQHGEFEVTGSAWAMTAGPERWEKALTTARKAADPGVRPRITSDHL